MNEPGKLLLSAVAGGAIVGAFAWWLGGASPPSVAPSESAAAPAPAPLVATTTTDLAPVLGRLDAMDRRLGRIEDRLDGFAATPVRTPVSGPAPSGPIAVDVDALQRALEGVEQKKRDAKSDDELLRGARVAAKTGDVADGIAQLQALLQRPLTPDRRAEAMLELGMLQRQLGTRESLAESARTLQQLVDANGMESKVGRGAAYQLVWTCADMKDAARGIALAQAYSQSPSATPYQRVEGRWATAILMQGSGDAARARQEFEALLRDMGDQAEFAKLATDIRQRLGKS
ncbi:MAG: hypothetical protein JNK78_01275 [Planctomycetes bacterium]|nr:hypothetical protein [Planctomycetota bacterium]